MISIESIEHLRRLTLLVPDGKSYFISQHGPLLIVEPDDEKFTINELVYPIGEDLYIIDCLDLCGLVEYSTEHLDYVLIGSRIGPVYGQLYNEFVTSTFNCYERIFGSCLYCPKSMIDLEQF